MSDRLTPAIVLHERFDDFELCSEKVRGWSLDFEQIDNGPFRGSIIQLLAGSFQLGAARFNRRLHQRVVPPTGLQTFCIPRDPRMEMIFHGKKVHGNCLISMPVSDIGETATGRDFDILTPSLSLPALEKAAWRLGLTNADKQFRGGEARHCDPEQMDELRKRCSEILDTVTHAAFPGVLPSGTEDELAGLVAEAWLDGERDTRRVPYPSRVKIVRLALDHLHNSSFESITVGDLCRVTQVSKRTLQYCFGERFGISPKQYILAHRLCSVRRALRRPDPSKGSIVKAANEWGFWHMGQFAAAYRRQFGELPSQTLKRWGSAAL